MPDGGHTIVPSAKDKTVAVIIAAFLLFLRFYGRLSLYFYVYEAIQP